MQVGIHRFRLGRHPDSCREWSSFMKIVQNFRKPLLRCCPVHILDFLEIGDKGIAVVVMSGILLIQFGHTALFKLGADIPHIPI